MKNCKSVLLVAAALLVGSFAQAQTKSPDRNSKTASTAPSKSMKVENTEEKKSTTEADQEEKFVWTYSVVEVYGGPGEYVVNFGKPSGEMNSDMKRNYMMAERMQSASSSFKSEMDILQMFTSMEMELITVLSEDGPKGPKKVYYTRNKSQVQ